MTDRIPCVNPDCSNTVLPDTAARNSGFCMPCVLAKATRERDEHIRANRRDVDEFAGVSDPVEILKIIHRPRKIDPLINWIPCQTPTDRIYVKLDRGEVERLSAYAEGLIGTAEHEVAEAILGCLAAFTDFPLDRCQRALVSSNGLWPSLAFRGSPPDVRDSLIARVDADDENRNLILLALAWIGDDAVVSLFEKWCHAPPDWRKSMFIPPHDYSREAGWELTPDGRRRNLYFGKAVELKKGSSDSTGVFRAISSREDNCPWCGSVLTDLFHFDLKLCGLDSTRDSQSEIRIPTCEICTGFGTVFGTMEPGGGARWSKRNVRPEYLPDDADSWDRLPVDPLKLGAARSALFAADQFLPTRFSQLGGHPTWIQDAAYPACPDCGDTMIFVGQIDHDDIEEYSEGLFYAFICQPCQKTATCYQQS